MRLLSIQSHVAYGHVGNSAAVFPLQRLGCEVWPIHTVQFSNHTGYGSWTGQIFDADVIRALADGVADRDVLGSCSGVISGYMGAADLGAAILAITAKVKAANPAARYCCDPVIGDVSRGIFVRSGIPEFIKERAVPAADIVTPNHFEFDYLAGVSTRSLKDVRKAVDGVRALGPETVLVTSLQLDETPSDSIDLLAGDRTGHYRLRTPKLPMSADGAGDLIAALFSFHLLDRNSVAEALSRSASSVFGVLKRTSDAGTREMLLIEAQEEIVRPSRIFSAEKI
jgi:pyridoxine kinase